MIGSSRRAAVLIALGATLLALSYPPFRFPPLSFVAVAPAVVLVRELEAAADLRQAAELSSLSHLRSSMRSSGYNGLGLCGNAAAAGAFC